MGHLIINDEKSFDENVENFVRKGCPCHVDFNSEDNTKYIKWLIDMDKSMDKDFIPYDFTWKIITSNEAEIKKLNRYLKLYIKDKFL